MMKSTFQKVPERPSFPKEEEKVLEYWNSIDAFQTQLKKSEGKKEYTFYDGPPFATGLPHYGHIAAGTIKDIVTRYATQTGHHVDRRFGWDCHGLPVEYEIDQKLNIHSTADLDKIGISSYNNECRAIVMRYSHEWERVVNRFGRWIDFQRDYKTMDITFMESVWWVFSEIYKKGLVYKGAKVMPYSNKLNTVLSNFEAGQNYKDTKDPSVVLTFPLLSDPKTKILAWTTTPWTLPTNFACAMHPEIDYVKVQGQGSDDVYIVAEARLKDVSKQIKLQNPKVLEKFKGAVMDGQEYDPLFTYFQEYKERGCFKVKMADFVTTTDGTGIVHCATFGEEDFKMFQKYNMIDPSNPPCPLDLNGRFVDPVTDYKGLFIKDADKKIMDDLKARGRLLFRGEINHSYPFCWRSDTPLIYKPVVTWFIKVTDLKEDLLKNNEKAYWVPDFVKSKRFHNWLTDAKDWCFSRNRYWGNPIPLWVSEDGEEVVCIGSIEELKKRSGVENITDLHRDYIDNITIPSEQGKGVLRRIPEVFDCWFESGSMPFAQFHYPFAMNDEEFNKRFPGDFIAEGIDQTRGWFYTLNVIGTAIKNSNPYKNLVVNGICLAEDGKKMSKRLKNYPDPIDVCNQYGADACRLYLANSPIVRAEQLKFQEKGVEGIVKNVFLPWFNVYRFLVQNIQRWEKHHDKNFVFDEQARQKTHNEQANIMDRWIVAEQQKLIKLFREEMGAYRLYTVVPELLKFLRDLTNWYVRLNRNRLKGETSDEDRLAALNTLFDVTLSVTQMMSPFTPFITEFFYQNLRNGIAANSSLKEDSIHFLGIPQYDETLLDDAIIEQVDVMQRTIELGRLVRDQKNMPIKHPLTSVTLVSKNQSRHDHIKTLQKYVLEELNVQEIKFELDELKFVSYTFNPDRKALGQRLGKKFTKQLQEAILKATPEQIEEFLKNKKVTLAGEEILDGEVVFEKKFKDEFVKNANIGTASDNDVCVILDLVQTPELKQLGVLREGISKVQKARKEAGLQIDDPVAVVYDTDSAELKEVIEKHVDSVLSTLKIPFGPHSLKQSHFVEVTPSVNNQLANGGHLNFYVVSENVVFHNDNLSKEFGEEADAVKLFVVGFNYPELKQQVNSGNGELKLTVEGKQVTLKHKQHFFFGIKEATDNKYFG